MRTDVYIKQVIVVEGKTDTQKLQNVYGYKVETIETNGLNLNNSTINLIKKINETKGIIIFTDPDGPGKKIRQALNDALDGNVANGFITKEDIIKPTKKIGIAEASNAAIKKALSNLLIFNKKSNSISWTEFLHHDFYLKENRKVICRHFGFDEKTSNKALFKWINWMNIKINDLEKIIQDEAKR